MSWKTWKGKPLEQGLNDVLERDITNELSKGNVIKLCVGTDSQVKNGTVFYATVVVILRLKKGGYMYIRKSTGHSNIALKHRMIEEVGKSVAVAYELSPIVKKYKVPMEVHADINANPQFLSHVAMKEAMGYIVGMGFEFKAKPDAFASSSCADKFV